MTPRRAMTWVLLGAAIASGWSIWKRSHPVEDGVLRVRPDYVLRDFEVVSLDRQGKEAFTLLGPELQRNPVDHTMTLDTPRFLVPDGHGHYWDVRARSGLVPADGRRIELRGGVQANSPPQTPPPTQIVTDRLALDLNRNLASTSADVILTRPGLTMQGKGLEADFERQQVSLLSQVHTRYVPQH